MSTDWITVKEAALILGYSQGYFRSVFCQSERPLVTIREMQLEGNRRRILVSKEAVEHLNLSQLQNLKFCDSPNPAVAFQHVTEALNCGRPGASVRIGFAITSSD